MGITFPSPERLATYINREELPRRLVLEDGLPVSDIFRYGGMVGSNIKAYTSLPRCMDQARELIEQQSHIQQSLASGTMLFAESLTGSKGRFRRAWYAPNGGLWCVLAVFNQWSRRVAGLLPLAAGLAVCETVQAFGLQARVKWVNDICYDGLKLAGLLAETYVCPRGEEYILLGIGLNVNNDVFPPELVKIATSMSKQAGNDFSLADLGLELLAKLSWNVGLLTWIDEQDQPLSLFMDRYRLLCDSVGRRVRFGFDVQQSPQYEARVTGIQDDGGLVLRHLMDDGSFASVDVVEHSGEMKYLDSSKP